MKKQHIYLISLFVLLLTLGCSEDTIEPDQFSIISGDVIDQETGLAIEGVQISSNPSSEEVFSNSQGKFILNNAPLGTVTIQGNKDGYLLSYESVNTSAGNTTNTILEMIPENANNSLPEAPVIISPENESVGVDLNTSLVWNQAVDNEEDELTYTLTFFEEGSSDIQMFENLTDTTFLLSNLSYQTTYYWQLSVKDDINEEEVSTEIASFTTRLFPDNRVYFTRKVGTNNVIYSTSDIQEGAETIAITDENINSWRPRFNPSVNLVAFLRNDGSETHIYTMNKDGSNVTKITQIPIAGFRSDEIDFTWAENGEKIIYPYFDKLYSINNDGSGQEVIYSTPNGKLITEVEHNDSGQFFALKVNNNVGYEAEIYTINYSGNPQDTIIINQPGAVGGLDISFDGDLILYTHDISGSENNLYRLLNSRLFIYDRINETTKDYSVEKPDGFNDLDPRFSPNEAEVIFTFTSNDNVSTRHIYKTDLPENTSSVERTLIESDAFMPDWE